MAKRKITTKKTTKESLSLLEEKATMDDLLEKDNAISEAAIVETPQKEIPDSGILCPDCRFKMRVYRTKSLTGTVSRERICDRCGHREDTEERIIK
jgi:hypothetical protein